ncbi:cytochrome c biogenesis protein ResB [Thiomonas sp.]|uniref:cytochrome c biogenesis protein ResB n=1 Tax=Thiomonas sp. TaxID=2047785 RepID=UPI002628385C|nr:cytochrome c biogenesis protein ResB [Thiomonas sp.]
MSATPSPVPNTTLSTSGWELQHGSRAWRAFVELLSSMRFAIALLVVVAIASIIGTVLTQGQPYNNYINQFGPFWAEVFRKFELYNVYSSWWFLLILTFLVVSTSLCLIRNTPKIVTDLKTYKEGVREQSLRHFHERAEAAFGVGRAAIVERLSGIMRSRGYTFRVQERPAVQDDGAGATMIAAKTGGLNRIGYVLTHAAFVMICVGALFDGDMMIKAQMWLFGKEPLKTNMLISQVPEVNKLSVHNPTFRGNLQIPDGGESNMAVLTLGDGVLLQPLPFEIHLKKFNIDFYSTGMPRLYSSDVVITDPRTGKSFPAKIEVNHPLTYDGVTIFQSGFADGGSELFLKAWPMHGPSDKTFDLTGTVGSDRQLSNGQQTLQVEFSELRVFNVQDMSPAQTTGVKPKQQGLMSSFDQHLGAPVAAPGQRHLQNIGPAVIYKIRDASGQAHEYFNYMLPVELDGQKVFLAGERGSLDSGYKYMRIPADGHDSIDGWMRLRAALFNPKEREQAAAQYVATALPPNAAPELKKQLQVTAMRTLDIFAGEIPTDPKTGKPVVPAPGGLPALAQYLEAAVPPDKQQQASDVFVRILNGTLWQLWQISREQHGEQPVAQDAAHEKFFDSAVLALSDSFFYPSPLYLQLTDYKQVQASIFQVARAPGKVVVYTGAVLLILGVFAMLYIRERRVWFLVKDRAGGGSEVLMAMSTNRRTLEYRKEFETLRAASLGVASTAPAAAAHSPDDTAST